MGRVGTCCERLLREELWALRKDGGAAAERALRATRLLD
jgi:hypothetical protein